MHRRARRSGVLVVAAVAWVVATGADGGLPNDARVPGDGVPDARVIRAGLFAPADMAALLPGIGELERGNRHFRAGRYREAVEAYRAALADGEDTAVLRYNLGTALLRLGEYAEAEEHLRAALDVVDPETREWVYYNLGNRYLDDARAQPDPRATAALYDAAVESYRQALRLQPGDEDAKWNYELALREREQQQSSGGGGGEEGEGDPEDQQGDQGGEGQSQGRPSRDPAQGQQPGPSSGQAPMSQEQAERILSAVEQDERELFQDKLRKGRQEARTTRDW